MVHIYKAYVNFINPNNGGGEYLNDLYPATVVEKSHTSRVYVLWDNGWTAKVNRCFLNIYLLKPQLQSVSYEENDLVPNPKS